MRTFIFSLLLILVPLALAYADEFGDFRIPAHSVYTASGTLDGINYGNLSNYTTGSDRYWRYTGGLSGSGGYLWDSDSPQASLPKRGNWFR